MAPEPGTPERPDATLQARDVVAFGQEFGRVLSDGRIVGRAEPFAKVFPSSRAVKRAVGLVAWGILEDIALDAQLDDRGRLVAETNIRRIAANLDISKNTVTRHVARLREYGFVLHEEIRDDGTGRYELSRYVLDPSACIERFTTTPAVGAPSDRAEHPPGPCPKKWDTDERPQPCPKKWDTAATVSQSTGHRDLGQNYKKVVVEEQQLQPRVLDAATGAGTESDRSQAALLAERLTELGVCPTTVDELVGSYPADRIHEALQAVAGQDVHSPAGWLVTALRDGWDLQPLLADQRAAQARREREHAHAAAERDAAIAEQDRQRKVTGWCAALSAALDDHQLATAIAQVTTPLPSLNRRSVGPVRAQLLSWCLHVHTRAGGRPLPAVLQGAVAAGARPVEPWTGDIPQPPPPAAADVADLDARIRAVLEHGDLPRERSLPTPAVDLAISQ